MNYCIIVYLIAYYIINHYNFIFQIEMVLSIIIDDLYVILFKIHNINCIKRDDYKI